jgi:hypothetical protein
VKQHVINSPAGTVDAEKLKGKDERNTIAWPGTGHYRFDIMREPRWEDFEFERTKGAERSRYEYFGNLDTARETRFIAAKKGGDGVRWDGGGYQDAGSGAGENDVTGYLKEVEKVDLELLHEVWNE